jgi:hypothetical protein
MRYMLLATTLILGLCTTRAQAQLASTSRGKQRTESRKALRDARRYPAEYKDSHLVVTKPELKEGNGGRLAALEPKDEQKSYKFDRSGTPRVSEPSRVSLRPRKKDKEPTP